VENIFVYFAKQRSDKLEVKFVLQGRDYEDYLKWYATNPIIPSGMTSIEAFISQKGQKSLKGFLP